MSTSNGFKSAVRTAENVLTVVVNVLGVVVLAAYLLVWTGLAVRHVFAGDLLAALVTLVVFVAPVVVVVLRRRMKAAYLAREAAEVDLDVGSPSP